MLNVIILLMVGMTLENMLTLLILDSMIIFGISIISMITNLIKKRKIRNDIKFNIKYINISCFNNDFRHSLKSAFIMPQNRR